MECPRSPTWSRTGPSRAGSSVSSPSGNGLPRSSTPPSARLFRAGATSAFRIQGLRTASPGTEDGMHPRGALRPVHPGRGGRVFRALLALLAAVLLGGCAIAVDSGGGSSGGGGSGTDSPIDSVNRTDLDEDERGAVS